MRATLHPTPRSAARAGFGRSRVDNRGGNAHNNFDRSATPGRYPSGRAGLWPPGTAAHADRPGLIHPLMTMSSATEAGRLAETLRDARHRVDEALGRYVPEAASGFDCPPRLAEAMRYSL